MPNRVVALTPPETGSQAAREAADQVRAEWRKVVGTTFSDGADDALATPGVPLVHWVCVRVGDVESYPEQWQRAHRLLGARRGIRDFEDPTTTPAWHGQELCSLSARWPAGPVPSKALPYETTRPLSTVNRVKQLWRRTQNQPGFPSTESIASADYRRQLLDNWSPVIRGYVKRLWEAADQLSPYAEMPVPGLESAPDDPVAQWFARRGGPWVHRDKWQLESLIREYGKNKDAIRPYVELGSQAVRELHEHAKTVIGHKYPPSYLAVLVQDLDSMGRFMRGGEPLCPGGAKLEELSPEVHSRVSLRLQELAGQQRRKLCSVAMGVPVYAGGDDLLALLPASTALRASSACHELVPTNDLPTASTAVLYFHYNYGLQPALSRARKLLEEAKEATRCKHALAIGFLRRSGESGYTIQPWIGADGRSAADVFDLFAKGSTHQLSPRLVWDLIDDADELNRLAVSSPDKYRAELARLVGRHLGDRADHTEATRIADALAQLGMDEGYRPDESIGAPRTSRGERRPEHAARVGVFMRQEAR